MTRLVQWNFSPSPRLELVSCRCVLSTDYQGTFSVLAAMPASWLTRVRAVGMVQYLLG